MVTRVVKTIGTGGDFSTPATWIAAQPYLPYGQRGAGGVNPPSTRKYTAGTFVGTFTQNETLTATPSLGAARFLDSDGATYIVVTSSGGAYPKAGQTVTGGSSGATCVITAEVDSTGVIWEGQVLNQEIDMGSTTISLNDFYCTKDCYNVLTAQAGASFMDNVNAKTNPLKYDGTVGAAIKVNVGSGTGFFFSFNFSRISKLQMKNTSATGGFLVTLAGANSGNNSSVDFCDNMILENFGGGTTFAGGLLAFGGATIRNTVGIQRGAADRALLIHDNNLASDAGNVVNCTFVVPNGDTAPPAVIKGFASIGTLNFTNCGMFVNDSSKALTANIMPPTTYTTSYTDVAGTTGITQTTYSAEYVDYSDATSDFRLKAGAVQIGTGTVDRINALNDVVGTPRPQGTNYDVGAWEYNITLDQVHYRFRTDAGAVDAAPTWGAAQDTTYQPGIANFRLRVAIENSSGAAQGPSSYQLQVSKNGGAYAPITTSSSNVQAVNGSSDPDGTIIKVPQLTATP